MIFFMLICVSSTLCKKIFFETKFFFRQRMSLRTLSESSPNSTILQDATESATTVVTNNGSKKELVQLLPRCLELITPMMGH